jgi:hypothetical protein
LPWAVKAAGWAARTLTATSSAIDEIAITANAGTPS